jgi:DNA polymerase/3'-5' exonuclease PolX
MDYLEARQLAERVCHQLTPHCDRIKICGSIRRKKQEVSDIDIVALPKSFVGQGYKLSAIKSKI